MAANITMENNEITECFENNSSKISTIVVNPNETNNETNKTLHSQNEELIPHLDVSNECDDFFLLNGPLSQSRHLSQSSFQSLRPGIDYTFLEYEIVTGYRQTSKLLYAEQQFYRCNTKCRLGISYLCANTHCTARVYIIYTNQCIRLSNSSAHVHGTKAEEYAKLVCLNEIKRRCGDLKYLLNGQKVTVRDIFNEIMLQYPDVSLDYFQYERTLQLIRSDALPKNPTTCDEILHAFHNRNVMNSIGRSQQPDNPTFFNGAVQETHYSFCVFSSKTIMSMIDKHIELNSRYYLLDATFNVVPVGPFNQLLIFYVNYIDKIYPFIYVLMSRKTEACYSHVLRFIEENLFALRPLKITTDYEVSMQNALQNQYPEVKFVTSWFHFIQAVKKNASKLIDFINFIRTNDNAKIIYYKLMALPLLPAKHIKPLFIRLKSAAFAIDKRKFDRFVNYFEKQWIEKEGPSKISVFGKNIRITDSLEAYNHTLAATMAKKGHFYRFAIFLNQQDHSKSMEMEQYIVSGGLTNYKRKRQYKDRNAKIQEASVALATGDISPMNFLNRILHNEPKLLESLIDFSNTETTELTEIDQFNFEISNERQQSGNNKPQPDGPEDMNPYVVLNPLPLNFPANLNNDAAAQDDFDHIKIKTEPELILVTDVSDGQFDEFDVNMCIDPITVKPNHIDNQNNVLNDHEPVSNISSECGNEMTVTKNNESNFVEVSVTKEENECEYGSSFCTGDNSFRKECNDHSLNESRRNENPQIDNTDEFSHCFNMKCKKCENVFESLEQALNHYNQMHNNNVQNGYIKCCNLQFIDTSLAIDHLNWHLNPDIFKCTECNETLPSRKELQSHGQAIHTLGLFKRQLRHCQKQGLQKPKRKFKCDICLKFCSSRGCLYTHKRTHQTGQFKCTLCDHISLNAAALASHKNAVHVKSKFICHFCDKSFKTVPALKVHIARHFDC